jgi:hemerythrin-like domain-containing protein
VTGWGGEALSPTRNASAPPESPRRGRKSSARTAFCGVGTPDALLRGMTTPTELASRLAGKVRATASALRGERGIFKKLKEEHGEIVVMLGRVGATLDPAVRAELFPKIRSMLLSHSRAEQAEFYSVLSQYEATRSFAEHGVWEHRQLDSLIDQLTQTDPDEEAWVLTFDTLATLVHAHIMEEEEDLFPRAKAVLSVEESERIEVKFSKRKIDELGQTARH